QRDQALPARQHLRIVVQGGNGLVDRPRADVVELSRDHWSPPLALRSASQTRCGEHGIGTSLTPYGRSASTTALTTAGVDAMVPASPTPLTPSGLVVAGVSVRSLTIGGKSKALGSK